MNINDREQAFEIVENATLKIFNDSGKIIGTGFYVSSEGHFVTCAHVVEDAGGIKHMKVDGREAIRQCYIGDPTQDDIALLQIINRKSPIFLPLTYSLQDNTFRCFGFSNETYRDGAPIEGKIVAHATSTDSTLANQRVLRLLTEGDSQAIKCGQSGSAACIYNARKKRWEVIGVLVASEGENGGIALQSKAIPRHLIPIDPKVLYWYVAKVSLVIFTGLCVAVGAFSLLFRNCSDEKLQNFDSQITALLKADIGKAIELANKFENSCPNDIKPLISHGFVLLEKSKNRSDLDLAKSKFLKVLNQTEYKNNTMAIYGLGLTYRNMQEYEKAIDQFKKIEDDEQLKIDARYNIGYSYSQLNYDYYFKDIEKYLEDVIRNIQKTGIQWNVENSKDNKLYSYHLKSLLLLINSNEKMWYSNRKDISKSQAYIDNYLNYRTILLQEVILPEKRKDYLDQNVSQINSTQKQSDSFKYVAKTENYKDMLCNFYKAYNVEKSTQLGKCKS